MSQIKLHNCSCGCKMFIYSHGVGPHVNLVDSTHKFIKYGLYGNHAKECLFFNSELYNGFDSEEEAAAAWNNIFK